MRANILILLFGLASQLPGQSPNEATLTFVVGEEANEIDIDLDISLIGASSATSVVAGTMDIKVNIAPGTATTDEFTILSADASASDVELSRRRPLIGRYDLKAEDLTFTVQTTEAPGEVDPITGEFDASQHEATTTSGSVSGSASALGNQIDIPTTSLTDPPFSGSVEGTGTITVTPGRIEGRRLYFDLAVTLPIGLSETVPIPDAPIDVEVDFALGGELQASGETFLEYPDYPSWAANLSLPATSQDEHDLRPAIPNYFFYALGFDGESPPTELFTFGPTEITLKVGSDVALDSFEIEWSDDLENWTRVPAAAITSGSSVFSFGDSFDGGPAISLSGAKKYFRLARSAQP